MFLKIVVTVDYLERNVFQNFDLIPIKLCRKNICYNQIAYVLNRYLLV